MQATEEFCELLWVGESRGRARTRQLLTAVEAFQPSQEFAAKDATQDSDGQEERVARADPPTMIRRESAAGNDTVNVGMQEDFWTVSEISLVRLGLR
jgi:hypothetical protein